MHNVPLDDTYNHTIKFASLSAQQTYFSSAGVVKYTLNEQSYQRVERGKMRVEIKAEDLYDCDYLSFQNTSFGNKWFYAFITGVEYVNNVTSEITFEIDVMQTYLFDITVGECFVEREHVVDDSIGANTIAEPVDCPEAEVSTCLDLKFTNWYIAINFAPSFLNVLANGVYNFTDQVNTNIDGKIAQETETITKAWLKFVKQMNSIVRDTAHGMFPNNLGDIKEHQYTGQVPYITTNYFDDTTYGNANAICQEVQQTIDLMNATGGQVLNVYQVPDEIVNNNWNDSVAFDIPDSLFDPIPTYAYIDKNELYTPKNNKLYTSPYTYLKVINKQGGEMNLAYEKIQQRSFRFWGSWQNGEVACFMANEKYGTKYTSPGESENLCRLPLGNFPVCNFNTNGIFSRLTNCIQGLTKTLSNTIQAPAFSQEMNKPEAPVQRRDSSGRFAKGSGRQFQRDTSRFNKANARYDAMGGVEDAYNTDNMIDNYIDQLGALSNNFIGSVSGISNVAYNSNIDVADSNFGYAINVMQITAEYAKIIDNFFERFGYAVKLNKVPNMDTRPHWNYVKTTDAYIKGNCPADALSKIISIFNHGVTFWKVPSEVGNYSLDNHIH